MADLHLVRVGLAVPLPHAFDYLCPEKEPLPPVGARVRVPFGKSERIGVVLEHPENSLLEREQLRFIIEPTDEKPLLEPELLELLRWAAGYYHHPIGEVVSHALPALLRKGRSRTQETTRAWSLTAAGREQDPDSIARRAPKQAHALKLLAEAGTLRADALAARGVGADVRRRLQAKRWIDSVQEHVSRPGSVQPTGRANRAPALSQDQQRAVDTVLGSPPGFGAFLLHGVTGSGKTEVYLRLIENAREIGQQSLLLVPEIGLTPQLVKRLDERFGSNLAVLHSGLSDSKRLDAWMRAHEAEAGLVVGTRSAVFASMPRLGLIVIDEEHDGSFKQQTGFRYSARDLALMRARKLGIRVVLGSATPSLESYYNARTGRYRLLSLPQRIGAAGNPRFRLIDLNKHASTQSLSTPLVELIDAHLARDKQVILFLNRRGFAPALFCPECTEAENCDRCDASLTVHAKLGRLRCHHCGREKALIWSCPKCGSERIAVGAGTQRVDDQIQALKPEHEVARLDRDSTSRKGALDDVLENVASGKTRILVGTQMLTKGHDFPNVTLVGILNADQGLFGTDFRSEERLAQTIVQVAGRAGRREDPGEVVIQTHYPDHRLLQCLLTSGYAAFAELALSEREAAGWPPYSYLAVIRAEARQRPLVFGFLNGLRNFAEPQRGPVAVMGPAASAMERQSGRYRAQLVLRSETRGPLHALLSALDAHIREDPEARRVRWSIDVDPIEV